jgi:peptide/nickel transport system substrate-binding protein
VPAQVTRREPERLPAETLPQRRREKHLVAGAGTLLVVVSGIQVGCRSPAPTQARPPRTLTVALRADVTGFYPNPPTVNESFTFEINRWVYDSLVAFDPALRLVPLLATRWENPDDRTYLFELRAGVRFSDGRSLTAPDVAASLRTALERGWATHDYLWPMASVRALDERRVEVRTRGREPTFLTRLPWGFVLPAEAVAHEPIPVVGTGPYRLGSWTPGKEFVLLRNPHYWGDPAPFESARFVIVPDDAERVARVERGEADVADNVPLEAFDGLERRTDLRLVVGTGHRVLFLALRMDRKPFRDPRVREAVELALDREELVGRVLQGRARPAFQLLPPSVVGHDPDLVPSRADRVRARRLLTDAGYPHGFELRLDGPNNRYVKDAAILAEVARQLRTVGIEAVAAARDKQAFFRLTETGASDAHLLGWASESGDGGDALDFFFRTPAGGPEGRLNTTGISDERLDTLIQRVHESYTVAERSEALRRAFGRMTQLRPIVPLVIQVDAVVHNRRVAWHAPLNLGLRPGDLRPVK